MADINQIITVGIGTPADIPHFILVGLSPSEVASTGVVRDQITLGTKLAFDISPDPILGGRGSW